MRLRLTLLSCDAAHLIDRHYSHVYRDRLCRRAQRCLYMLTRVGARAGCGAQDAIFRPTSVCRKRHRRNRTVPCRVAWLCWVLLEAGVDRPTDRLTDTGDSSCVRSMTERNISHAASAAAAAALPCCQTDGSQQTTDGAAFQSLRRTDGDEIERIASDV